ncbi:MAG: L-lactate dehydrogenase [Xanthomonadales bacterium]|nr:L-lactate dehydrogenase [Gammaproteobacteria bacterium]NND57863.1 L-lactate dehydrogenase [Xanthomonadales bacterium]NNK50743.1 L-lactate dehydrogenase [Xanthomonadales bacterium]
MTRENINPVTVPDYRLLAKKRLPRFLFDYVDGGANEEVTMAANMADFSRYRLKQRVMRDVGQVDTEAPLCGSRRSMPLVLAPVGMAGLMARRGEVQGARAAKRAGVPFTASTVGICPVEEIKEAIGEPCWFQLYMLRDRGIVERILERAARTGCETLIFTVDLAVTGMRHRDWRNGMLDDGSGARFAKLRQLIARPGWLWDVGLQGKPHDFGNLSEVSSEPVDLVRLKNFIASQFDPTVTWKDIAWLRERWKGRLLIKGVLSAEDAQAAVDTGADGVIVSNHGGRQLDCVASGVEKLPEVVRAVGAQAEVLMDGGVRNGIDVVKAVALGAKGVLIGRPWVWAVAGAGEEGLTRLLGVFQEEIRVAMALMGVNKIDELTPDLLES